jgi:hypothetical protein
MQGASMRSFTLVLLVFAATFAAPATALAKPNPAKYVLVSHTKGALVAVNAITGKLTFKPEPSHFGHFTVVLQHGTKKLTYRFTVTKPKGKSQHPIVTVKKPPGVSRVIIIIIREPPGSTGSTGVGSPPPLTKAPPVNLSPPELRGNPVVGGLIMLTYGTWSGSTSQTGVYYDCDAQGQQCSVDSSQPAGDLYVVQSSDIGHSILLAETATGPGGTTTVDSTQTAVVPQPPAPPTGLTATPGNGLVLLSWQPSPAADAILRYNVYRTDQLFSGPWATPTGTSFTNASDVVNGTRYCYQVSATNANGESATSAAVCATPTATGTGSGSALAQDQPSPP